MAEPRTTRNADWLTPAVEQEGLKRYVQTVRERIWIVALAVIVTTAAAAAYVALADDVYEAEADVLVTPVPDEAEILVTVGLIRESSDPLRAVETAARLITNIEVAELVREDLGLERTAESLLDDVSAEPVAESNIVAVTAQGPTAVSAAELANAFAQTAIQHRTDVLHERVEAEIPVLEGQLSRAQLSQLEILRAAPDPTLQVETEATPPTSPVAPRPLLSIAGGILGGLVLGVTAAFAFQALDPRLRREEQLRASYRLPILARIPKESRRRGEGPLAPERLSPAGVEAFRMLRATIGASRTRYEAPRSVLITGAMPAEGKTTTAINLAASVAMAGSKVILIEADLRKPAIGEALGVRSRRGVVSVLIEEVGLEQALITTETFGPNLRLLLSDHSGAWASELFALPAAQSLIEEAKGLADFVVLDSPPLSEVVDAMPLARQVDDVLIVVRLGETRLPRLSHLGELLAENGIRPVGFAVQGVPLPSRSYYAEYTRGLAEEIPEELLGGPAPR